MKKKSKKESSKAETNKKISRKKILIIAGIMAIVSIIAYFSLNYFLVDKTKLAWKVGTAYVYDFEYKSNSYNKYISPESGDKEFTGSFDCKLQMSITPVKKLADGQLMSEFTINNINHCSYIFNNEDILQNDTARQFIFLNRYAGLLLSTSGAVADVRFKKNEDPVFVGTVKMIAAYMQTAMPGKKQPPTEEWDQNGQYNVRYSYDEQSDALTIVKNMGKYKSLLSFPSGLESMEQDGEGVFKYVVKDSLLSQITGSAI